MPLEKIFAYGCPKVNYIILFESIELPYCFNNLWWSYTKNYLYTMRFGRTLSKYKINGVSSIGYFTSTWCTVKSHDLSVIFGVQSSKDMIINISWPDRSKKYDMIEFFDGYLRKFPQVPLDTDYSHMYIYRTRLSFLGMLVFK